MDGLALGVHVRPFPVLQLLASTRLGSMFATEEVIIGLSVGKSVELFVIVTVVWSGQIVICSLRSDDLLRRCRVVFLVLRSCRVDAPTKSRAGDAIMDRDIIVIVRRTWYLILNN
jgi:hypothetical protein